MRPFLSVSLLQEEDYSSKTVEGRIHYNSKCGILFRSKTSGL
jgi:hypothetical protein